MGTDRSITTVAEEFLRASAAERDLSPHTIAAYRSDLAGFADWAQRSKCEAID